MGFSKCKHTVFSLAAGGLLLAGLLLLLGGAAQVAHADPNDLFAAPEGSGNDCSQASPCALQTALDKATDGDTIYLAQGVYTGTGEAVITLIKSITLYGGWDGFPTGPIVRDPDTYPTILDGENQRRVIYIGGNISPTIEGFVIARGNASHAPTNAGYGGGIYSLNATPIIANNLITGNVAYTGTAIAGNGGGLCIVNPAGTAVITGNRVISNVASLNSNGAGGGIRLSSASHAQVINNVVLSNTAALSASRGYGGGIIIEGSSEGTMGGSSEGTMLSGNRVQGNVALARSDGSGQGYGGGIDVGSSSVLLTDNDILSNTAVLTGGIGYGGGIALMGSQSITVTGNRIEHNIAQAGRARVAGSYGGGIYCFSSSDVFVDNNTIRSNIASISDRGGGGGIGLWWRCDRATITGNTIQENQGAAGVGYGYGGGLLAYVSFGLQIEANRILSNTASTSSWSYGGGLYIWRNTTFTMTNNIVVSNIANREGGGMAFETWGTDPVTGTLVHNTFVANDQGSGDGRIAIHLNDPRVTLVLTNNLIYSHTYGVYATTGSTATLYNTLFYAHSEGDIGGDGTIINSNPITGQNPLLDADYHLLKGSPAIDAGIPLSWVTADIDGDPRPDGTGYDIGADEFQRWHIYLPLIMKSYP